MKILIKLLSDGIQKIPPILVKFQKLHHVPNLKISGTEFMNRKIVESFWLSFFLRSSGEKFS